MEALPMSLFTQRLVLHSFVLLYIQGDQKVSVHLMITIQKVTILYIYGKLQVMFKVSPTSLHPFIDTRLTLTPSVIPNSNYVITVSD
jgi:hypothetical protein